jgi:hypothetical protein
MLYKTIAEGCSWTVCRHAGPFSDQLLRIFSLRHLKIIFHLLLCWVGLHCGIYKSSYDVSNISHLNSPPPLLPFIPTSPDSWNRYNRCIIIAFTLCVHLFCTIFTSYPLSPPPHPSYWYQPSPLGRTIF